MIHCTKHHVKNQRKNESTTWANKMEKKETWETITTAGCTILRRNESQIWSFRKIYDHPWRMAHAEWSSITTLSGSGGVPVALAERHVGNQKRGMLRLWTKSKKKKIQSLVTDAIKHLAKCGRINSLLVFYLYGILLLYEKPIIQKMEVYIRSLSEKKPRQIHLVCLMYLLKVYGLL